MRKHLETAEEVITALGGPKAVAKITGYTGTSTVPSWKWRKAFPARTFTTIQSELQKRGLSAPNKLWGMP